MHTAISWIRAFAGAAAYRFLRNSLLVLAAMTLSIEGAGAKDCTKTATSPGLSKFYSNAWGIDARSTRFQPDSAITPGNVAQLKLKLVYGFANDAPRSYPLVTGDTIFVGDAGHGVVALDRQNGCVRWTSSHPGAISTAILHEEKAGGTTLFFSDRTEGVFALNAKDGTLRWKRPPPGDNPVGMLSGTALVQNGTMFVPLSSLEIGLAANPFYGCCSTSGGMAAIDTASGKSLWYRRTMPGLPVKTGHHYLFVDELAPSGGPVWGAPTLDAARGVLYFGDGQNYSRPATTTSDSIFALNAKDGSVRWIHQFHKDDAYNTSCDIAEGHPNCPKPLGPDLDFGAPPILAHTQDGRTLLIAGEKSGEVYALDPDTGKLVWTYRAGRGGALGGVHWGMAVNEALGLVFVPVSDIGAGHLTGPGAERPGLFALDIATGAPRWSHLRKARCADRSCSAGLSAAIIANPDLVFAGGLDGKLEAVDAKSGQVLWSYDSWRDYPDTVNGTKAKGGAFDAHGPMLADDQLIVASGYSTFFQRGGNALLVFQLDGKAKP